MIDKKLEQLKADLLKQFNSEANFYVFSIEKTNTDNFITTFPNDEKKIKELMNSLSTLEKNKLYFISQSITKYFENNPEVLI